MLRVTAVESGEHRLVLQLEGTVSGPWVGEVRKACERGLRDERGVVLNLAEVSFVDNAGLSLLRDFQARGVELADCSFFVKEQLRAADLNSLENGSSG